MFTPEIVHLHQLCRLGIPGTSLAPVLFQELKRVFPCDSMTLLWQEPGSSAARVFHESETEVNCGFADAECFSQMCFAAGAELYAVLAAEHPMLRHIARLLPGVAYVVEQKFQTLAVCFSDIEKCSGAILLHRSCMKPFSTAEKALLVRLSPVLSSSLGVNTDNQELIASESNTGILLLDSGMKIQYACCRGRKLIQLAQASINLAQRIDGESDLARRLLIHCGTEESARDSNFLFHNSWGSFEFFLHRLSDSGIDSNPLTAVAVHHQEPLVLSVFRGCKKLALTEKQTEIALLLIKGLSYDAVATRLSVRSTTVVDHVRKIYEKVGVANRSELVTALLLGAKKSARVPALHDAARDEFRMSAAPSSHAHAGSKGMMRGHTF